MYVHKTVKRVRMTGAMDETFRRCGSVAAG